MDLHEKSVQLRFRQRIGSFCFDRVLSRQNKERIRQFVRLATYCQLTFLHRLKQCTLSFRWCAVDFVSKDHVSEQWTFDKLKDAITCCLVLLEHLRAGDVTRHQVWCELNPAKRQIDQRCHRRHEHRLCQTGHPLQNTMPFAEHRDQELLCDFVLTDNDASQLLSQLFELLVHSINGLSHVF